MFKKINKLLLLLLGLILILSACSSKPYDILFDKIEYDFGTVGENKDVNFAFEFRNTGTEKLIIENVQPGCGCTVTNDWDREVLPGKKGKIPVTFQTAHYKGDIVKMITVITNVPEKQTIQLTIKGNVFVAIEINPNWNWLGEVTQSTKIFNSSFEIKNNQSGALKILEVIPPDPHVKFSLTTLEENQKYRLDFSVEAPFDGKDRVEKRFTIKTDSKESEFIYPTFYYNILPLLQIFPEEIYINPLVITAPTNYDIYIRSGMSAPIEIQGLKLYNGNGLTTELKENIKGQDYVISLIVSPGLQFQQNKMPYLTFRVKNDPDKRIHTIKIFEIK